ncbi:MAG: hypothetical protein J1G01_07065 [Clostridiales bacterium]|nr:hypothetical protein [Clostridiales bacterium]
MKNPHQKSEYVKLQSSDETPEMQSEKSPDELPEASERSDLTEPIEQADRKTKKPKFSGAYYYVDKDEEKIAENAFIRTTLTIIAFMLQLTVLLLPQDGLEYITKNIPSYAYAYMWIVLVMLGVSIWLIVMNMTRYKFRKRIPKEHAPRSGFKRTVFFGTELYIAVNAVMAVLELSFVCIYYDAVGLVSMFICVLALGAAIAARQVTYMTFKNAELILPPEQPDENNQETQQDQ